MPRCYLNGAGNGAKHFRSNMVESTESRLSFAAERIARKAFGILRSPLKNVPEI